MAFLTAAQLNHIKRAGTAYQKRRLGEPMTNAEVASGALVGPVLLEAMRCFGSRFSLVAEELVTYSVEMEKYDAERRK